MTYRTGGPLRVVRAATLGLSLVPVSGGCTHTPSEQKAAPASSATDVGNATPTPPRTGTAGAPGAGAEVIPPPSVWVASGDEEIIRFAAVGDFGSPTDSNRRVAQLVRAESPAFVVTLGDNNYPDGAAASIDRNIGAGYASFIGDYHGAYGPGSPKNRFFPSLGNHDWSGPDGIEPHRAYFSLPGNERYYDVDFGLVHLFALDSDPHEPDGTQPSSAQGRWLKDALSHSKSCFDIVYFHHAPYSSGRHGSSPWMQWPFKEMGADVILSGHDHHYERLEVSGLPYFVNGLGGASLYPIGEALPQSKVRYHDDYGAMFISATARGLTLSFWTIAGKKVDEYLLEKACVKPASAK